MYSILKRSLRYFFELRFLPKISVFLFDNETWLRLLPVRRAFRVIDPGKNKRIIDVGGGTGRLEMKLGRTDVFIYDINEDAINIAKQNFENAILGSGTKIDFDDNYFDWAISVHTLEHIPQNERENFILESIRISGEGIFMNFPEGTFAEKLCHNFLDALKVKGLEENKWTIEHLEMGIPRIEEIKNILEKQNKFEFEYKLIRNFSAENLYWTKIMARKGVVLNYVLSPLLAIYKYLKIHKKPTIELLLIGSKDGNILKQLFKKL